MKLFFQLQMRLFQFRSFQNEPHSACLNWLMDSNSWDSKSSIWLWGCELDTSNHLFQKIISFLIAKYVFIQACLPLSHSWSFLEIRTAVNVNLYLLHTQLGAFVAHVHSKLPTLAQIEEGLSFLLAGPPGLTVFLRDLLDSDRSWNGDWIYVDSPNSWLQVAWLYI